MVTLEARMNVEEHEIEIRQTLLNTLILYILARGIENLSPGGSCFGFEQGWGRWGASSV